MKLRYQNKICRLASLHKKETAIGLPFEKFVGCKVVSAQINTDLVGTFTGEFERMFTPRAGIKETCDKELDLEKGTLGVANGGGFGPRPSVSLVPADFEIIFFANRSLASELTLTKLSLFPSHAPILHPHDTKDPNMIFKNEIKI